MGGAAAQEAAPRASSAGGSDGASAAAPLPAACAAALDGFCGNVSRWLGGATCFNSSKKRHPGFTRFYAAFADPAAKAWRCYSPYSLASGVKTAATPIMLRTYSTGPGYCSPTWHDKTNGLAELYYAKPCPGVRPPKPPAPTPDNNTLVFPAPADIPSLAYAPPGAPGAHATRGTLVAFKQQHKPDPAEPWARTSTDHGKTWAAATNPATQAGLPAAPGPHSVYCCSQSVWDATTKSIVLQFGNSACYCCCCRYWCCC